MARIPTEQPPGGISYAQWEAIRQEQAAHREGFDAWWAMLLADMDAKAKRKREPSTRLEWLLNFIQEDLKTLTADERAFRANILRAIFSGGYETAGPMDDATLKTLQRRIGEGVRGLARGVFVWIIPGPSERWIQRTSPAVKPGRGGAEVPQKLRMATSDQWGRNEVGAILNGVANLVLETAENLRACLMCGKPFLGSKRQIHCSPECGQARRDAKKAAKVKEQAKASAKRRGTK